MFLLVEAPTNTSTESRLNLVEVDPVDGRVIREVETDIPFEFSYDLTYVGNKLYAVDNFNDVMHELAIDGQLIRTVPLGRFSFEGGYLPIDFYGTAVIGESVLGVRGNSQGLQIVRLNEATGDFEFVSPVSFTPTFADPIGQDGIPYELFTSVGVNVDGNSIELLEAFGSRRVIIDPATGNATVDENPGFTWFQASDSVGQETFQLMQSNQIDVFNDDGQYVRSLQTPDAANAYGLAVGEFRDNATSVVVSPGQIVAGVNHSAQDVSATISGTVTTFPTGQEATVYLDLNQNGSLDPGEPSTTTDVDGDYIFESVVPGDYTLRQVAPAEQVVQTNTDDVARLYTLSFIDGVSSISELDPLSGQILYSFVAPGPNTTAGMASYQGRLFLAREASLYEINPDDGETISTIQIPFGRYGGVAIVDSIAYLHDLDNGLLQRYDLNSKRMLTPFDLYQLNSQYFPQTGGLSESADGASLLITVSDQTFRIDPETGIFIEELPSVRSGRAMAGAAGQWFEPGEFNSDAPEKTISVRDNDGFLMREIPVNIPGFIDAMAAETIEPSSHRVQLFGGETKADFDFLNLSADGTITGTQFVDTNANGVLDLGEIPIEGATVFVDLNSNQLLDAGEPQTTSAADGTYTLANIPLGSQVIRSILPEGYSVSESYEASDRLFLAANDPFASTFVDRLRILEINPVDGSVVRDVETDIQLNSFSTFNLQYDLTFAGNRFYAVDNANDLIHELTLDGQTVQTSPLGPSNGFGGHLPIEHLGTAVIDESVLGIQGNSESLQITRLNRVTGEFEFMLPVSLTPSSLGQFGQYSFSIDLNTSVGVSADGTSIELLEEFGVRRITIDPATGNATIDENPNDTWLGAGDSVGQETFYLQQEEFIEVFDDAGNLIRTLQTPNRLTAFAVAAGAFRDNGQSVVVEPGQIYDGINHVAEDVSATISGNVLTYPAGQTATLYLDLNDNGSLDAGEPSTVSDVDGDYVFERVLPGNYALRQVEPADQIVEAITGDVARLFTLSYPENVGTISEIDPVSGETLNSFAAPGPPVVAGMASHQGRLFLAALDSLYEIDANTGETISIVAIPFSTYEGLAIIDSIAYLHDTDRRILRRYNVDTKQTSSFFGSLWPKPGICPTIPVDLVNQQTVTAC